MSGRTVRGNRGTGAQQNGKREAVPPVVPEDRLLDAVEAAELLHVPVSWVREETRQGRLPHRKLGRYRRYVRAELLEWVDGLEGGGGRKHRPRVAAA